MAGAVDVAFAGVNHHIVIVLYILEINLSRLIDRSIKAAVTFP